MVSGVKSVCVCVHARSHVHTLSCSVISDSDFMDYSPPSSSVQGIFQARVLDQVAISYARGSSRPRDGTCVSYVSCIGRLVLYHQWHLGSPQERNGSLKEMWSFLVRKEGK